MISMLSVGANPDLKDVKDDPILDLLQREYSILQDKIDKIGGFRFTIKGWALTLNTGALVAAFAASLAPIVGVLLVSGLVFGLWSLEWRQAKLTDLFQSRTFRLEARIMRRLNTLGIRRGEFATLICCPGIANELRTPIDAHRPDTTATSALRRRKDLLGRIMNSAPLVLIRRSKLRSKLVRSDFHFYVLLWGISVAFIFFQQSHAGQSPKGKVAEHLFRECSTTTHRQQISAEGALWRAAKK